jgi:glycosyltransferase involved in cell wall biosynthesis
MEKPTQRLLMIAYYFPPLGGAGVQRSAKFAKYLARLGWQVKVITVVPPSFELLDTSLEAEIHSDSIEVNRVPYRARFRQFDKLPGGWRLRALLDDWLQFPDRMQGWFAPALAVCEKIYRENPGIPIFSTSAPYTAHLIARELKRRYGSLWIADFRDEWSQNPYLSTVTGYHLQRHQKAEQLVLNEANVIISVTDSITKGLKTIAPASGAGFFTIPNGFDPEDFAGLVSVTNKQWTLTHVGTLNQAREQLLIPVIKALKDLIARGIIPLPEVKLQLIGVGDWRNSEFTSLEWVETKGYLCHAEALAVVNSCSLAILAESNPAAFTGKIFEYLALQRPILGLVHPESPAAQLIKEAHAGWVVGLDDKNRLTELLTKSYQNWRNGNHDVKPRPEVIGRFNREQQAAELAQIIRERLHDGN